MKFLLEHEMAIEANELGFPSIMGCHAVLFQTDTRLYGYHILGGNTAVKWNANAAAFAAFVNLHRLPAERGTRLYGAGFIGNNGRAYDAPTRQNWIAELTAFATALGFAGKISGYDLHKRFRAHNESAYAEFCRDPHDATKCQLKVRAWGAHEHTASAANLAPLNHHVKKLPSGALQNLASTAQGVNRAGVFTVSKDKLR